MDGMRLYHLMEIMYKLYCKYCGYIFINESPLNMPIHDHVGMIFLNKFIQI